MKRSEDINELMDLESDDRDEVMEDFYANKSSELTELMELNLFRLMRIAMAAQLATTDPGILADIKALNMPMLQGMLRDWQGRSKAVVRVAFDAAQADEAELAEQEDDERFEFIDQ